MNGFQHILVPTDFSEPASRAVDMALMLAARFEAKVTLLHVTFTPITAYAAYAEGMYWPTEEMTQAAQKTLDETLAKAKERYANVDAALVGGEAWQTILESAKQLGADLLVMGTHGRRGLSRMFLGSVTERVVRLSPIPVLTISGQADQDAKAKAIMDHAKNVTP